MKCLDASQHRLPIWSADQSRHHMRRFGRPHSLRRTVPGCGSSCTGQLGPRHLARTHEDLKPLCQPVSASGRGTERRVNRACTGLTAVQSTRPEKPATQREGTCARDRNNHGHQRRKETILSLRHSNLTKTQRCQRQQLEPSHKDVSCHRMMYTPLSCQCVTRQW